MAQLIVKSDKEIEEAVNYVLEQSVENLSFKEIETLVRNHLNNDPSIGTMTIRRYVWKAISYNRVCLNLDLTVKVIR